MKRGISVFANAFVIFTTFFISGCNNNNQTTKKVAVSSVSITDVRFGTADMGCTGRGLCTKAVDATGCGTPVSVTFSAQDANQVSITFKVTTDTINEPGQSPYWRQGAQPYSFDCPYSISRDNPVFANDSTWPFVPGDIIPANTPFQQTMDTAGNVTMTIPRAHSTAVTAWVILGGKDANGAFNPAMNGIFQCSPDSIPPVAGVASFPVTFSLATSDASFLLMSFKKSSLQREPAQDSNFVPGKTTYPFANPFAPANPAIFGPVKLPAAALIDAFTPSTLNIDTVTGIVIDSLLYGSSILTPACGPAFNLAVQPVQPNSININWVFNPQGVGVCTKLTSPGILLPQIGFLRNGQPNPQLSFANSPAGAIFTFGVTTICTGGTQSSTSRIQFNAQGQQMPPDGAAANKKGKR